MSNDSVMGSAALSSTPNWRAHGFNIFDAAGNCIACCDTSSDADDAQAATRTALIVKSVNAFAPMRVLLERLVRIKDWDHDDASDARNEYEVVAEEARAALKLAGDAT